MYVTKKELNEAIEALRKELKQERKILLKYREAIELSGLGESNFKSLIEKGILKPILIGEKQYYFTRENILELNKLHTHEFKRI